MGCYRFGMRCGGWPMRLAAKDAIAIPLPSTRFPSRSGNWRSRRRSAVVGELMPGAPDVLVTGRNADLLAIFANHRGAVVTFLAR
jgi:hypothetical protein